jgi:flagellar hook assembly protein FlgD
LGDGIYTFSVEAEDASGNPAGEIPYSVNFEVINESSVTNFYPYPNPFSTSTRFVFTLTGSYIPDNLKIQILTVTGRVVREIMMDELGPIRIGNNITDYAWDGRDEYGDQLANGVYLYRVILDTGSNSIKHRSTAGDKAFDKGYGKLYILR